MEIISPFGLKVVSNAATLNSLQAVCLFAISCYRAALMMAIAAA